MTRASESLTLSWVVKARKHVPHSTLGEHEDFLFQVVPESSLR